MAQQLGERAGVQACFADLDEMLRVASPDVVHITTPPQGRAELTGRCLDAGSHVYVEKPFTVTAAEAEALIEKAMTVGRKITAGHNYQFTPEMLEMRRLVREKFLGGQPIHLESHWFYDLGDTSYVGPMLGNPRHWVRQLPGGLLHNLISHGLARLAEFLSDEIDELIATAHVSPALENACGGEVLDELRVMMRDGKNTTAYFTFSTQIKPPLNRLRICGPLNSIEVDLMSGSVLRQVSRSDKSYLTFLLPPLRAAKEQLRNAWRNAFAIPRRRLYHDGGMTELIRQFHRSISENTPPPIPYREILLTARLMDEIFSQISPAKAGNGSDQIIAVGMRFVLVTPARNEELFIAKTIDSVLAQTVRPERWAIVDDGSTDGTPEIIDSYAKRYDWIEVVGRPQRAERSFAGKVSAFDAGFERVRSFPHELIVNLDADVLLEADHFEFLVDRFKEDSRLGVAGTAYTQGGLDSVKDSFEGEESVAGPLQFFRKECFEDIGGFVPNPAGGVDWIAVTTARMRGWKTRNFPERRFQHQRYMGTAEKNRVGALFDYGKKDYFLGRSPVWQVFRAAYRLGKRPIVFGGLALLAGYVWAGLTGTRRAVTPELMKFHRQEQMRKLGAILRALLRFEKVERYRLPEADQPSQGIGCPPVTKIGQSRRP